MDSQLSSQLIDFLYSISDFLDDQADADCVGDPPRYKPNKAMQLMAEADDLVSKLETQDEK